ncbi:glycoside hydrolase family 28 protein, partial [Gemmiger formicilis]
LEPQTEYRVDVVFDNQPVGACMLRTGAEKQRINVTEAPYWAKGDGKTKNTAALQRAIDACGPGDAVYLPAGVYLTGAL